MLVLNNVGLSIWFGRELESTILLYLFWDELLQPLNFVKTLLLVRLQS